MRKQLRKKEIKELIDKIENLFNTIDIIDKKDIVLIDDKKIIRDNELIFFYHENHLVPSLKLLLKNNFLKKITVDMGAVKFVTSGADIMRPGITEIQENIQKDEIIAIIDETHKKPLAVGQALYAAEEMTQMDSGKVIKNIHYVGDDLWN